MKNPTAFYSTLIALALLVISSASFAEDPIRNQILKLFPQADADNDGVLSDAEEATVIRVALKRFPQADRDGDGQLSQAEKKALLRQAARRNQTRSAGKATDPKKVAPTHANVQYGEHERQVFDIWLAESSKPSPLAIYIHGGGFKSGSKEKLKSDELSRLLDAGISVAAINYRYATMAPLPAAHEDAKRALQFMRSKAEDWKIDKQRVAAFGGSAGAQICMWLAFSDEMARPESSDPIERESTRLKCVASAGGQTSNGKQFWLKTIGPLLGANRPLVSLANPLNGEEDPDKIRMLMWGADTVEEADATAAQYAALTLVSADDPPIFMTYGMSPTDKLPRDPAKIRGWLIHHVNLGIALKEKTDALNLEAHLKYPGANVEYNSTAEFFAEKLLQK